MDIIRTEKIVETTTYGVVVKKAGDTYFVYLKVTANHQTGEIADFVVDIIDEYEHHHKETLLADDERFDIVQAVKALF